MDYRYIAVEGNIGSGKTTLAHQIANTFNARMILEQFADNPFLPKFYADKERYAFPLELSFLADRYNQLKDTLLPMDLFQEHIVADYTFIKSQLFAQYNLTADEYALFERMAGIMKTQIPKPDVLIYLHTPIPLLQQRIKKRGRSYEQDMNPTYLEAIEQCYLQYLEQESGAIIMVDGSKIDFNIPEHYERLIQLLNSAETFSRVTLS
jgi:deoxyguanosine kinase